MVFFWGCAGTPFLISGFDSNYKPKLKTAAFMPFSTPLGNRGAEENCSLLEEKIAGALVQSDSVRLYLMPSRVRARLGGMADSAILHLPVDSVGRLFSAEALLYCGVIRLH
ncbi:MAG TPA: hypothetical protein VI546_03665, partial [candidate division Zixibacteria bacterium]|nr:hypothetical protein [candidate division Zixibacteria bacterium]